MGSAYLQENAVAAFKISLHQHLNEIGVIRAMKVRTIDSHGNHKRELDSTRNSSAKDLGKSIGCLENERNVQSFVFLQEQLHRKVMENLPRNAALPSSVPQQSVPSVFAVVVESLIAEYLAVSKMGSTLSALQSESSLRGTILSRAEILQLLNVRPGTHIWEALAAQGVHPQGPSGKRSAEVCASAEYPPGYWENVVYGTLERFHEHAGAPHGLAVALLEAMAVASLHEQTRIAYSQIRGHHQACLSNNRHYEPALATVL
jgi:hypothetical protein